MTAMITDSSLPMILSGTAFVLTIYGAAIVCTDCTCTHYVSIQAPFGHGSQYSQASTTLSDRIGIYEIW